MKESTEDVPCSLMLAIDEIRSLSIERTTSAKVVEGTENVGSARNRKAFGKRLSLRADEEFVWGKLVFFENVTECQGTDDALTESVLCDTFLCLQRTSDVLYLDR